MLGRVVSKLTLVEQLRTLGVAPGQVLLVHASFRALRPVEDGPRGVLEALLEAIAGEGTLVMPSWTGRDDVPFDPRTTPAAPDLGVVADAFWRLPGVLRSDHPFAFAAHGPRAAEIVSGPIPFPPHLPESPVGRVFALDGWVLLAGVGHEANTSLHLAELLAAVPYRVPKQVTVLRDGLPVRVDYEENDHCCARFSLADGWLRQAGAQAEGRVGNARARLFRARQAITLVVDRLRGDPLLLLHASDHGCAECDAARASVEAPGARRR